MKTIRQIKLEHKVWQLFPDLDGNCLIRQKVHCAKLRASWLLLTWLTNRKIANLDWNDVTDDVTIGKFCSFLRSRNNKPGTLLTLAYILRSYSIQSAWALSYGIREFRLLLCRLSPMFLLKVNTSNIITLTAIKILFKWSKSTD